MTTIPTYPTALVTNAPFVSPATGVLTLAAGQFLTALLGRTGGQSGSNAGSASEAITALRQQLTAGLANLDTEIGTTNTNVTALQDTVAADRSATAAEIADLAALLALSGSRPVQAPSNDLALIALL
jgi:uncharacterized 2Fe-2S/4Fe-4S cluster protein (DUF4445 family)